MARVTKEQQERALKMASMMNKENRELAEAGLKRGTFVLDPEMKKRETEKKKEKGISNAKTAGGYTEQPKTQGRTSVDATGGIGLQQTEEQLGATGNNEALGRPRDMFDTGRPATATNSVWRTDGRYDTKTIPGTMETYDPGFAEKETNKVPGVPLAEPKVEGNIQDLITLARQSAEQAGNPFVKKASEEKDAARQLEGLESSGNAVVGRNLDIHGRPKYRNPDGSVSTVDTIGVGYTGRELKQMGIDIGDRDENEVYETVLPTIRYDRNGNPVRMSEEEAEDWFRKTGEHFGIFENPDDAGEYADTLHRQQEYEYSDNEFDHDAANAAMDRLMAGTKRGVLTTGMLPEGTQLRDMAGVMGLAPEGMQGPLNPKAFPTFSRKEAPYMYGDYNGEQLRKDQADRELVEKKDAKAREDAAGYEVYGNDLISQAFGSYDPRNLPSAEQMEERVRQMEQNAQTDEERMAAEDLRDDWDYAKGGWDERMAVKRDARALNADDADYQAALERLGASEYAGSGNVRDPEYLSRYITMNPNAKQNDVQDFAPMGYDAEQGFFGTPAGGSFLGGKRDESRGKWDGYAYPKHGIDLKTVDDLAGLHYIDDAKATEMKRWSQTTPEERKMFYDLYDNYGADAASDWLKSMEPQLNKRLAGAYGEWGAEMADANGGVTGFAYNVAMSPFFGAQTIKHAFNVATGKTTEYDPSLWATYMNQGWMERQTENITREFDKRYGEGSLQGKVANFLFQNGYSILNNLSNQVVWGGFGEAATLASMGLNSAASAYQDALDSGASEAQANALGLFSGIFEAMFERVSLEKLLDPDTVVTNLKEWAIQTGLQGLTEGSEEIFTEIANQISNFAIMGGDNMLNQRTEEYYQQMAGSRYLTPEAQQKLRAEARSKAIASMAGEVLMAGAGGMFSGMIMGGAGNASTWNSSYNAGTYTGMMKRMGKAGMSFSDSMDAYNEAMQKRNLTVRGLAEDTLRRAWAGEDVDTSGMKVTRPGADVTETEQTGTENAQDAVQALAQETAAAEESNAAFEDAGKDTREIAKEKATEDMEGEVNTRAEAEDAAEMQEETAEEAADEVPAEMKTKEYWEEFIRQGVRDGKDFDTVLNEYMDAVNEAGLDEYHLSDLDIGSMMEGGKDNVQTLAEETAAEAPAEESAEEKPVRKEKPAHRAIEDVEDLNAPADARALARAAAEEHAAIEQEFTGRNVDGLDTAAQMESPVKAVDSESGMETTVIGIRNTQDGLMAVVETQDGRKSQVPVTDLAMENGAEAVLESASGMTGLTAQAIAGMVETYTEEIEPRRFTMGYKAAYNIGRMGQSLSDAMREMQRAGYGLSNEAVQNAWASGAAQRNSTQTRSSVQQQTAQQAVPEVQEQKARARKLHEGRNVQREGNRQTVVEKHGSVQVQYTETTGNDVKKAGLSRRYTQEAFEGMSKSQRAKVTKQLTALDMVAKKLGINVKVVDGITRGDGAKVNGYYQSKNNQIILALDANENAYSYIAMHEFGHQMASQTKEQFQKLTDVVREAMGTEAWNAAVKEQSGMYADQNIAIEEVVANSLPSLLMDEKFARNLYLKDASVFQRVMDWVRKTAEALREAGEALSQRKGWGQMAEISKNAEAMEKMAGILESAMQNMQGSAEETAARFSVMDEAQVETIRTEAQDAQVDGDDALNPMGIRFNVMTEDVPLIKPGLKESDAKKMGIDYEKHGKYLFATVRDVSTAAMKKAGWSQKKIDRTNKFMDKMDDFMRNKAVAEYQNIGTEDVNDATILIDHKTGKVLLSCRVKNGEYEYNFDLTKTCAKREAMQRFVNDMAGRAGRQGGSSMLEEIDLSQENIFRMNEILRDAGYNTACLGCFVEARRYNIKAWANTIVDEWNAEVRKADPNAGYFDFSRGNNDVDKMSRDEVIKLDAQLKQYKTKGLSGAKAKMPALVKTGANMQKLLRVSDLITEQGRTNLAKYSSDLESIVASRFGVSSPKAVTAFTPYNSEIALLDAKKKKNGVSMSMQDFIKSIGGVRSQSFSDFMVQHTYDNLQKMVDMAARGLTGQRYTKEIAAARLFGMSGEKINLSVMFDIDENAGWQNAGLDQDGNYLVSDFRHSADVEKKTGTKAFIQSIPWNEAVELEQREGYSKNCGIIGVGYSFNHIKKMMADRLVPYIIGYHRSGMPHQVAVASKTAIATDYTPVQNTKKLAGFRVVDHAAIEEAGIPGYATWQDVKLKKAQPSDMTFSLEECIRRNNGDGFAAMREFLGFMADNDLTPVSKQAKYRGADGVNHVQKGVGDFDLYGTMERTNDPVKTASEYIAWCFENGFLPEFYEFADDENYFKHLFDFSVIDVRTGETALQKPVSMDWLENVSDDDYQAMLEHEYEKYDRYNAAQYGDQSKYEETLERIYEAVKKTDQQRNEYEQFTEDAEDGDEVRFSVMSDAFEKLKEKHEQWKEKNEKKRRAKIDKIIQKLTGAIPKHEELKGLEEKLKRLEAEKEEMKRREEEWAVEKQKTEKLLKEAEELLKRPSIGKQEIEEMEREEEKNLEEMKRAEEKFIEEMKRFGELEDESWSWWLKDEETDGSWFSMEEEVEEKGDLIAVHNLTAENMESMLELGGFPMPSIAIMKRGMEGGNSGYGDISVVFGKETIDPQNNSENRMYGGDAWTPTFPNVYEDDDGWKYLVRGEDEFALFPEGEKLEYTPENIVEVMKEQRESRSIFGASQKRYGSIEEMKGDYGRLEREDDGERGMKLLGYQLEINEALEKMIYDDDEDPYIGLYGDMNFFDGNIEGDERTEFLKSQMRGIFGETKDEDDLYIRLERIRGVWPNKKQIRKVLNAMNGIAEMKTEYFEAKPYRVVDNSEIAYIVVPDDEQNARVIQLAKENGIPVITYKAGNENSRMEALNSKEIDAVRFSVRDSDQDVASGLEHLEKAMQQVAGHNINQIDADKLASKMIKMTHSQFDHDTLAAEIRMIYSQAEQGADISLIDDMQVELMKRVLQQSKTIDNEHETEVKEIRKAIKDEPLSFNADDRAEAANMMDSWGAYRSKMFGYFTIRNGSTGLDMWWQHMSERFPAIFQPGINASEMPAALMSIRDYLAPWVVNANGFDLDNAAQYLAGELNKGYLKLPSVMESAKNRSALGMSMKQYSEMQSRYADSYWQMYADQQEISDARLVKKEFEREFGKVEPEGVNMFLDWNDMSTKDRQTYAGLYNRLNADAREAAQEDLSKTKDNLMKANYIAKVRSTQKRLVRWLAHPTDKQYVSEQLRNTVSDLVMSLRFDGSGNKEDTEISARMQHLAEQMRANMLMDTDEGNTSERRYIEYDQELLDNILKMADDFAGKRVNDLSGEEMQRLNKWLGAVSKLVTGANKLHGELRNITVDDLAEDSVNEMRRQKAYKDKRQVTKWIQDKINLDMMDSFTFFGRLGDGAGKVFGELRKGFDRNVRNIQQTKDYVEDLLTECAGGTSQKQLNKLMTWEGQKGRKGTRTFEIEVREKDEKTGEWKVTGKKDLTLTVGQAMELVNLANREQAKEHMWYGGVLVEGSDDYDGIRIDGAAVSNIRGALTNKQNKFAYGLQQYMAKECGRWGNEVSMELLGYKKFGEKWYYPIRVDKNAVASTNLEGKESYSMNAIKSQGMTKALQEGAKNAIIIGDILDTFTRHVGQMNSYSAYAVPLSDFTRWYNTKGVKTAISQMMGSKGTGWIVEWMKAINGTVKGPKNAALGALSQKLLHSYKAVAVGGNIRVVFQQPTSIMRAMEMISPKYVMRAMAETTRTAKAKEETMQKWCGIAQWKDYGFFETDVGPGLKGMLFGDDTALDKAQEALMSAAGKADQWTLNRLWQACEYETRDLYPDLKVGTDEYYERVGKRMSDIVDRTQVVDSPFHRTDMMRNPNPLVKAATSFMAEPSKSYNMWMETVYQYAQNKRSPESHKKLARTTGVFCLNALATAAAAGIIDVIRDKREKKDILDAVSIWLERTWGNFVDNIKPWGMIPYLDLLEDTIGALFGGETYQKSGTFDEMAIQKILQSGEAVLKKLGDVVSGTKESTKSWYGFANDVAKLFSYATGVPVSTVMRDVNGLMRLFNGNMDWEQDGIINATEAAKAMYKAISEGKTAEADRIRAREAKDMERTGKSMDERVAKLLLADKEEDVARIATLKHDGKVAEWRRERDAYAEKGYGSEIVDKAVKLYSDKEWPKEKEAFEDQPLNVKVFAYDDLEKAVIGAAGLEGGTACTKADIEAMISEMAADSTAADPMKTIRQNVSSRLKDRYLKAKAAGKTQEAAVIRRIAEADWGAKVADWDKPPKEKK